MQHAAVLRGAFGALPQPAAADASAVDAAAAADAAGVAAVAAAAPPPAVAAAFAALPGTSYSDVCMYVCMSVFCLFVSTSVTHLWGLLDIYVCLMLYILTQLHLCVAEVWALEQLLRGRHGSANCDDRGRRPLT